MPLLYRLTLFAKSCGRGRDTPELDHLPAFTRTHPRSSTLALTRPHSPAPVNALIFLQNPAGEYIIRKKYREDIRYGK